MIQEQCARRVLEAALETGGDFSELYLEDGETRQLAMRNNQVENASYSRSHGAGVRVFAGVNSAYAYTNATDEDALLKTARAAAAAIARSAQPETKTFVPKHYASPVEIPFRDVDHARRIALLRDACRGAQSVGGEIAQVNARYLDLSKEVLVCNSEGVWAQDSRARTRLFVQATAAEGGKMQTGTESPGCSRGFEAYQGINAHAAGVTAARSALTMLRAPECPAAFLPVVIDGGFGGVIFHEACGHSLEATAVAKGNSEFAGKLGQKIAASCVSAVDDGTIPYAWGSLAVDDEGTPGQRNLLIENGVLRGYMIDRLGARRMGLPPTGNGRRQDYSFAPTSRMTNTFIAPGTDDEEEILRSLACGLYAKRMGGGSVNPLTGEFNFAVTEGYWVKNGVIDRPVRGATLVGRGADVLLHIDRVGKDMWFGQGMCGSKSGSVPTNVGQPRIRVSGITIGGKGGALSCGKNI